MKTILTAIALVLFACISVLHSQTIGQQGLTPDEAMSGVLSEGQQGQAPPPVQTGVIEPFPTVPLRRVRLGIVPPAQEVIPSPLQKNPVQKVYFYQTQGHNWVRIEGGGKVYYAPLGEWRDWK